MVYSLVVVHYRLKGAIAVEDIRLFDWRWKMRSIRTGYLYFEQKWNLDISERGQFRYFLLRYNDQLGLLPRLFPSTTALRLENGLARLLGTVVKPLRAPRRLLSNLQAWRIGYFDWPSRSAD